MSTQANFEVLQRLRKFPNPFDTKSYIAIKKCFAEVYRKDYCTQREIYLSEQVNCVLLTFVIKHLICI